MKNKFIVMFAVIFLLVGGMVFAQEATEITTTTLDTTTTTVDNTTTTIATETTTSTTLTSKPAVMPLSFTINKWFLQLRKAVTANTVQKAKIDTQILEKEEKAINKMIETSKIGIADKLVANYIQKKENITNQLEQLKKEGQQVDELINSIRNGTVDGTSSLSKKLENATDEQKARIITNLENRKENIVKRIEVKQGVLQNTKTDEELKALQTQITLTAEEHKALFDQLIELVKDKVLLLNEAQKNHFYNFLRSKLIRLTKEGVDKLKLQIADGSIKVELENIISKIVANPNPGINPEKKAIIEEKKDINQEIKEEKKGILESVKQKIQELKDTKVNTLTPEEKQKIMEEVNTLKQKSIEEKSLKIKELQNKMQNLSKPPKPPLPVAPMAPKVNPTPNNTSITPGN